jgi:hypothetical protein
MPDHALTELEALNALRQAGVIEAASIAALGRMWGWKRERTSKALVRWQSAGHVERKDRPGGTIIIRVPRAIPANDPAGNDRVPGFSDRFPAGNVGNPSPDDALPIVEGAADITSVTHGVPEDVPVGNSAVPAVSAGVKWSILRPPAWRPTVPAFCRWAFGGVSVALSFSLYIASMTLDVMFWSGLAATGTGKEILGATGVIIGLTNYAVPSAISFAPSGPVRLGAWVVWGVTMTVGAIAGASFVRNSLGTSEVSRDETIKERARLQSIIAKPTETVSDASVVDARARVETAKATARADCAPVKTKDIDQCNRSRAAVARAQDDLKLANERHDLDVKAAEQRHRLDVADAEAKLAALPATSADRNVVLAGVIAILPFASDGLVNGLVAALWVALFSFGPCTLLRLGLALLVSTRNRPLA